ncbi:MAG: TonB-dependent receptor [Acidobacteria bacterium]|nr:TonB-dependent receptor [Acidobacteriota bacterium]MCI0724697.1 TonB-dependent receptor [Acidobacteriota bacterium]
MKSLQRSDTGLSGSILRTSQVLVCVLSIVLLASSVPLLAQVTSTIQGHISDTSGASVPKAQVKATNESTGVSRTVFSAEDGFYRIPDLLPGKYGVRVELGGFKTVVKSGIELSAQSTVNLNVALEVGELTQTVDITAEEAQVETTSARISEVISENQLKSLPAQGRGIFTLVTMSPGITGKAEAGLDVFSSFLAPYITSGGNELKHNFQLDGISLRYGEGSNWSVAFSPNPDAITEVRVSTNPTSAESGLISGPSVQIVTKGGTNQFRGTGHLTVLENKFNAAPFRSRREDVPKSYRRYFGGTVGGPIIKERLFFFSAYEGLRAQQASSSTILTETQAFRDFVVRTRPNSVAARIFQDFPLLRYPTSGFTDRDGDGIPELGALVNDRPSRQTGKQFNGRIDYQSFSGQDRIFGSYWYTRPDSSSLSIREGFDRRTFNNIDYASAQHSHTFSPNSLNEARFGYFRNGYVSGPDLTKVQHVPEIIIDEGLDIGNRSWIYPRLRTFSPEFGNVFSLNRGRHGIKLGGSFRHSTIDQEVSTPGDFPRYLFASILDFANDNPYFEMRNLDAKTGKSRFTPLKFSGKELSFFVQNTWQMRPNLTFNYGLRWESYFSNWIGADRNNWQPVLTSAQVAPDEIARVISQKVDRFYNTDWNNFGPRVSLAWDPSGRGKMSIRGGFSILYDEINMNPSYQLATNPPDAALVFAGVDRGIPIVYGLAPVGTRDFPENPNLRIPPVNAVGAFDGTRPGLAGIIQDLRNPMIFDMNGGVQYQLFKDLVIYGIYRYRHSTDELYAFNANRFTGDLADNGRLDQLNPNFDTMYLLTNLGKRRYHGLVAGATKRFSQGWQLSASYTYNHGKNNYGHSRPEPNDYTSNATNAFDTSLDWARDDIAHIFHVHSVWELPLLRRRSGWLAGAFGGWELNTIWNLQSGEFFIPITNRRFGAGGDFNADGQRGDRPDRPKEDIARSFSKDEWIRGALSASIFPLPDTVRAGNLPRDFFRGPGYARVDAALVKNFPVPIGRAEKARLQVRVEAFNLFNRINPFQISRSMESSLFGRATSAYQMRRLQLALKFLF